MKYTKLYQNGANIPKYQGGGGASGAGAAHGRKNQPKVEVPEPKPTFWDHAKDVGEFALNQTLTPFETITGVNFYDPEFESDFMQSASDISSGIMSAATDVAGTMFLGPAYGMGKGAIQSGVSAAGLDEKWDATHSGHTAWADKTGQSIASVGDFASGFVQRGGNINNETMNKRNNLSEYIMRYGGHPKRYAYGGHPKRYQLMGDVSTETVDPLSSLKGSLTAASDTTSVNTPSPIEVDAPSTEAGGGDSWNLKGWLKGEQGIIPDYKGQSTKTTVSEHEGLNKALDKTQTALTVGGMQDYTGPLAAGLDAINTGISGARAYAAPEGSDQKTKHRENMALNAMSMVPGLGLASGTAALAKDTATYTGVLDDKSIASQISGTIPKAQTGFDASMFSVSGNASGLPMANMSDAATGVAYGAEGNVDPLMTMGNNMRLGGQNPMGGDQGPMATLTQGLGLGGGGGSEGVMTDLAGSLSGGDMGGLSSMLGGSGGGSGGAMDKVTGALSTGKEIVDIWKNPTKSEQLAQAEQDVENKGRHLAMMEMKNVQENVIGGPQLKQPTTGNVNPGSFLVQRGGSIGKYQNQGMVDGVDIEVEGGETISTIDGENNKFMGPSHDQGGITTTANEGDFVYPKGAWANRHKKRTKREAAILEKLENAGINTDELV